MCSQRKTFPSSSVRRGRLCRGDAESRAPTAARLSPRPPRDWRNEFAENRAKPLIMQSEPEHISMQLRSFNTGKSFLSGHHFSFFPLLLLRLSHEFFSSCTTETKCAVNMPHCAIFFLRLWLVCYGVAMGTGMANQKASDVTPKSLDRAPLNPCYTVQRNFLTF